MYRWALLIVLLSWSTLSWTQPVRKLTTEEYIAQYKDIAIHEMHRTGIPASIKLAQGILESGSGNSRLATEANNHFGIKCHRGWTGEAVYEDDDAPDECFRKYTDPTTSYLDHSEFLMTRDRYAFLFDFDKTDYKRWAHGLKKAGYATNPKYAPLLIGLIERYNLHQYDLAGPVQNPIAQVEEEEPSEEEKIPIYPAGIMEVNRADVVYLQHGQTVASLAENYNLPERKLRKWNDIDLGFTVKPGMYFYLQPKRNRGPIRYHRVAEGETMYAISQRYGIKVDKLYKRNEMEMGQQPAAGQRLYLRGRRDNPPKLRPPQPVVKKKPQENADKEKPVTASQSSPEENVPPVKPATQEKTPAVTPKYAYHEQGSDSANPYEEATKPPMRDELALQEKATVPTSAPETENNNEENAKTNLDQHQIHVVQDEETLYALSKQYGVSVEQIQEWNDLTDNTIQIGQELIIYTPQ